MLLVGCGSSKSSGSKTKTKTKTTATTSGKTSKTGKTSGTATTQQSIAKPTETSSKELQSISKKLGISVTTADNVTLYSEAANWIGTPYKYGGLSKSGVDCSGFTYLLYKAVYNKTLTRQSAGMLTDNCTRINKSQLKEGDLVFFRTDGKKTTTPNHVGVYLKNNKFVHASTSKGVVVSDLTSEYYTQNWISGGRVKK